ncbi:MAG: OsmC family protein [Nitrospirota bacterium]
METMTIAWIKGVQLAVEARGHRLLVDQPAEEGGDDRGMTPIELLVASLGACIGYFAVRFCQRHRLPTDGLRVAMGWDYAEQPHRVGSITANVSLPVELEPAVRERLQHVLEGCTVHKTLEITPKISVHINSGRAQG